MSDDQRNHSDKIVDLTDDLLTVLDGHMDEMGMDEIFYHALKFMTVTMLDLLENDHNALRILKNAMDYGILDYINKKGN